MRKLRWLSGLAVAGLAARAVAGPPLLEYEVNVAVPLAPGGFHVLDVAVGPVTLDQLLVQNVPPAREVAEASPRDVSRPRPVLVISNPSSGPASVTLELRLEDEQGTALLSCRYGVDVTMTMQNELVGLCGGRQSMKTRDWPRVKTVHLVGQVRAAAPATP